VEGVNCAIIICNADVAYTPLYNNAQWRLSCKSLMGVAYVVGLKLPHMSAESEPQAPNTSTDYIPQAYVEEERHLNLQYVDHVFAPADFQSVSGLMKGDTVLIVSGGVTNNVGEATIAQTVSTSYQQGWTPDALAQFIVSAAIAAAYNGQPDDFTCVIGVVCERSQ